MASHAWKCVHQRPPRSAFRPARAGCWGPSGAGSSQVIRSTQLLSIGPQSDRPQAPCSRRARPVRRACSRPPTDPRHSSWSNLANAPLHEVSGLGPGIGTTRCQARASHRSMTGGRTTSKRASNLGFRFVMGTSGLEPTLKPPGHILGTRWLGVRLCIRAARLQIEPPITSRLPSCADVSPHAMPDVLVLCRIMLTT
jgi:hypothetical protein